MFTLNYDFQPTDRVFVVIDGTRVEAGAILNVRYKIYLDENDVEVEIVDYTVLLDDAGEGTVTQSSATVFATLDEAGDYISNFLTPTPTVTATVTPTPTATVTPTISVTPTITPTITGTIDVTPTITPTVSITPTISGTPGVTPTVTPTATAGITPTPTSTVTPTISVTPTVTPTITVTPSASSIIQTLFILEDNGPANSIISQHSLASPNDMSSAVADNISFNISSQINDASGIHTDETGTILIILDNNSNTIHKYTMSTPWLITSAVYSGDFFTFDDDDHMDMKAIFFDPTGTILYIINNNGNDEIHQHTLGTAWTLSTVNIPFVSLPQRRNWQGTGLVLGDSGTKIYICGNTSNRVEQFDLSVAYDISDVVSTQFLSLQFVSDRVESIALSATGDKLFVYGDGDIRTYALATNWNVNGGTLEGIGGTYNPTGIGQGRSINLELYS